MLLTVFTPTFNRADTLERVFKSLSEQNFRDFEWLIVDDGSTDNTRAMVEAFWAKAKFPIRYIYQEHGGKHRAYNIALENAFGELFFAVDSDDWLTSGSLQAIAEYGHLLDKHESACGIIALKENSDGHIYGKPFPESPIITTLQNLEDIKCNGERSLVFKTEIARRYPFPTVEGETFVTESVIYDRIGYEWSFLAVNKTLTVCEYRSDGLSDNIYRVMWDNPIGFMIYHYQRIDHARSAKKAFSHALRYQAFRKIAPNATRWSEYKGRYRLLVNTLRFTALPGKLYYNVHCK